MTFPLNPNYPWVPAVNTITAISNANPVEVTTGTAHGYTTGMFVRIVFPFPYGSSFGMPEINGKSAEITVTGDTTFTMPINSLNYQTFSIGTTLQTPQVIPTGEVASSAVTSTQVNPTNPAVLSLVPIFQNKGLQGPGSTYRP